MWWCMESYKMISGRYISIGWESAAQKHKCGMDGTYVRSLRGLFKRSLFQEQ
jgi:hypothetical protein